MTCDNCTSWDKSRISLLYKSMRCLFNDVFLQQIKYTFEKSSKYFKDMYEIFFKTLYEDIIPSSSYIFDIDEENMFPKCS